MDLDATDLGELIGVREVSFAYEGIPVLRDVELSIRKGDFLALIGPNGSGKTTLIKVILGLLKPDRGGVVILGQPAGRFRDRDKIGYIPQKATHVDPLFPASVREVVAMALLSNGRRLAPARKRREAAIAAALEQVGMDSFLNTPVGSLSGGQQQRVFIARALVTRPEILFLDEPTTGVDAETQDRFYGMLDRLNKREGMTIVLVTHDIGIVNKHINKVACLNQKLVYHGSHEDFCRTNVLQEMLSGGHHLISHEH
ncbi:MAG: metal ABC transporter ATP-binding protein [Candidatus Aminicenantales bacterium]